MTNGRSGTSLITLPLYKWPGGVFGDAAFGLYWLFSVMERAGSTDPEKIIAQWEGDEFETIWGVKKMRALRPRNDSGYVHHRVHLPQCLL